MPLRLRTCIKPVRGIYSIRKATVVQKILRRAAVTVGNKNLDPEISINKEIGLEFTVDDYHASVTYFRNDYQNKIVAGDQIIGRSASGAYVLQWQNGGKALIEGIEASMAVPLMPDRLNWNTNATYMIASEQKIPAIPYR